MTISKKQHSPRKRITSHHQSLKNSQFPNGLQQSIKNHKRSRALSIQHPSYQKQSSNTGKISNQRKKEKSQQQQKPFMWGMDEESPRLKKKGQYEHLFLKVKLAKDEGFWKNSSVLKKGKGENKENQRRKNEKDQNKQQKSHSQNRNMKIIDVNSAKNLRKQAFMKVRQWSMENKQLSIRRKNMLAKQREEIHKLKLRQENEMEKKKAMRRRKILQTLKKQSERQRFKQRLVSFSSRRSLKSLKSVSPKSKKYNIKISKAKSFRNHHKIGSQQLLPIPTSILSSKRSKEHQISNNWDSNGNDFNQQKKKLFRRKMFDIRLRQKSMKLINPIKIKDHPQPGIQNIPQSSSNYKKGIKRMEGNQPPARKQAEQSYLGKYQNKSLASGSTKRYVSNRQIIERARQQAQGTDRISKSNRSVLKQNRMVTNQTGKQHRLLAQKNQHSSRI